MLWLRKKSIDSAMALNFDAPFNAEYGVNLDALCMRYESFKEEKNIFTCGNERRDCGIGPAQPRFTS